MAIVPVAPTETVESGRFFDIILQVPIGTATASQVIRGDIHVDAHWEQ